MPNDRTILDGHKPQVFVTGTPEPVNNVAFLILFECESVDSAYRLLVPHSFSTDLSH
jgi:hypothetical protein